VHKNDWSRAGTDRRPHHICWVALKFGINISKPIILQYYLMEGAFTLIPAAKQLISLGKKD